MLMVFVCRSGQYSISEAEGVQRGTKIVLSLKGDAYDYCKEDIVKGSYMFQNEVFPAN